MDAMEKVGVNRRNNAQMGVFRRMLNACNLGDLGFRGSKFTWSNKQSSSGFIKACLDRAMTNTEWCDLYPDASVEVLAARTSDHRPILIRFSSSSIRRGPSTFKYEASWGLDEQCKAVVEAAWGRDIAGTTAAASTKVKLVHCQQALSSWSSAKYGNAKREIKRLTGRLEAMQRQESPENQTEIRQM